MKSPQGKERVEATYKTMIEKLPGLIKDTRAQMKEAKQMYITANKQTKTATLSHIRVEPLALIISKSPDGCRGPEKAPSPVPGNISWSA